MEAVARRQLPVRSAVARMGLLHGFCAVLDLGDATLARSELAACAARLRSPARGALPAADRRRAAPRRGPHPLGRTPAHAASDARDLRDGAATRTVARAGSTLATARGALVVRRVRRRHALGAAARGAVHRGYAVAAFPAERLCDGPLLARRP